MRIIIVGTGTMARAVASRALAGGHHVVFVGTHIGKARELADEMTGEGPVEPAEGLGDEPADLVVLAVPYTQAPHIVRQNAELLARMGTAVVDVTNPVDLAALEPMDVYVEPENSAAEVIAAAAPPSVPVVKAFNTTLAGTLLAGQVAGQPLDVLIAGDDAGAKEKVTRLAEDGGMRAVDAGALARARELEALGYLHMVVQPALGNTFATAVKFLVP